MAGTVEIYGHCDDRFSPVKDAFANNFEQGLEVGASFAATIEGKSVVDIWGGYADEAQTRPWEKDTIVCVFSTTKVMTTICALMLIDRGLLDPDAPVAKYWPEFAQAGKETMPVRYLMSHTAGLPALDMPVPMETLYDWDKVVSLLAAEKPWWEPGKEWEYHALTSGFLVGELVRRITGNTLGTFFQGEVAAPLSADFHIGLPEEHEPRVGEMIPPPEYKPGDPSYIPPDSVLYRAMNFPFFSALNARDRAFRAAEIPAGNGHGNARSVARISAAVACGGELDDVHLLGLPTIEKALEEQYYGQPQSWPSPVRFGLGFGLTSKEIPIGPNPRILYWGGYGGSVVVMDIDAKLSCSYVMNKMGSTPNLRIVPIIGALYAAL
ncbi:MAG TPA: beta-lactamase family protein [Dehalococcoidia bacterium]|nr:beta-lactamase family protein [Dehalococcoidia bacterium]